MERVKSKLNSEILSICKQVFEEIVRALPHHQQTEAVKSRIAAHILSLAGDGETDRLRLREMAKLNVVMSHQARFGERFPASGHIHTPRIRPSLQPLKAD